VPVLSPSTTIDWVFEGPTPPTCWSKSTAKPMTPPRFDAVMNTLDQLRVGDRATIVDVSGQDGVAVRLLEMGLTEGEEIEVIGFAPLGDPIEFQVRGYRLSLRANEARRLQVERLGP
jgi:ferrous iron transport protein A